MHNATGEEFHYVLRSLSPYSQHTVKIQACNTVGCVNSTDTTGRTQQAGGYYVYLDCDEIFYFCVS